MTGDVSLSVGGGFPVDRSRNESTSPLQRSRPNKPLPAIPTRSSSGTIEANAERMTGAPDGTLYKSVGEGVTRQLTGFSPKEIKKSFKESWQKDKNLGPVLSRLKMAGRCLGFATGTLINITGRIAALGVALAAATTAGVLQFIFTPVKSFKHPHKVMQNIIGSGLAAGVMAGGGISFLGMKLSQCSAGVKLDNQSDGSKTTAFERVVEDSTLPGLAGMAIGAGIACLYPAMWQLPFKDSGEDNISMDKVMNRAQEIKAELEAESQTPPPSTAEPDTI